MVNIIDEGYSFGNEMGKSLGGLTGKTATAFMEQFARNKQQQKLGKQFKDQFGVDISQYPPEMQQEFVKQFAKAEAQKSLLGDLFGQGSQSNEGLGRESASSLDEDTQEQGFDLGSLSANQRTKLGIVRPDLAKIAQTEEKIKESKKSEIGKQHFEIAKDTLKDMSAKAQALPQKEMALQNMREAVESGDLSFFSRDNLAELLNNEGLRSAEGSVFKTAGKEFFIGNLGRVGARGLNQWLERQISDMMPKIGRSQQANLAVTEALATELDVEQKQIDITNKLANQDEKKYGYVRRDIAERTSKELRPYAIEKQKELKSKIENLNEKYRPKTKEGILMRDPAGNLRRVDHKEIKEAKAAGYREET